MKNLAYLLLFAAALLLYSCDTTSSPSTTNISGEWKGQNTWQNNTLGLELHLTHALGSVVGTGEFKIITIATPEEDIPLVIIEGSFTDPDSVYLKFTGISMTYSGRLSADKKSINGRIVATAVPVLGDITMDMVLIKDN